MKSIPVLLGALACLVPAFPCRAQRDANPDPIMALDTILGTMVDPPHTAPASAGPALTLEEAQRIALADNPEIRVGERRITAAESQVPLAGALEDPQLMLRSWGVPLAKPWDYNQSQNMLMISRNLPGPGKRARRTAVAQVDAEMAKQDLAETQLRLRVEVRKAFADLLRAQEEIRIHDEHVGIAGQAIEAARIKYTVGKIPQVEVLKAQLALTRLAEHMIRFERDAADARARLDTLLGRAPNAALQVEGDYGLSRQLPSLDDLESLALKSRPDLLHAVTAADKSRREQALAGKTFVPDFSVAGGYMLMPTGSDFRNNYMVEAGVSLPWLNRAKHNADLAQAAASTAEKTAEIDAVANSVRGQIQQALAEAQAAQRLARVYRDSLRPQSEQALHAAVIAYENDQTSFLDLLDSQMTVIDVDLSSLQFVADFSTRMADLEMAVGASIDQFSNTAPTPGDAAAHPETEEKP